MRIAVTDGLAATSVAFDQAFRDTAGSRVAEIPATVDQFGGR
jgi:hypothetical protein